MLKKVSTACMINIISEAHPYWDESAKTQIAQKNIEEFEQELDDVIYEYASTGTVPFFKYGEFSLFDIFGLREHCSFYDAVCLMDGYMKDEENGKLGILFEM